MTRLSAGVPFLDGRQHGFKPLARLAALSHLSAPDADQSIITPSPRILLDCGVGSGSREREAVG